MYFHYKNPTAIFHFSMDWIFWYLNNKKLKIEKNKFYTKNIKMNKTIFERNKRAFQHFLYEAAYKTKNLLPFRAEIGKQQNIESWTGKEFINIMILHNFHHNIEFLSSLCIYKFHVFLLFKLHFQFPLQLLSLGC